MRDYHVVAQLAVELRNADIAAERHLSTIEQYVQLAAEFVSAADERTGGWDPVRVREL